MNREKIEALIRKAYKMGFQDGVNRKDKDELREADNEMISKFLETNEPSIRYSNSTLESDGQTSCTRA